MKIVFLDLETTGLNPERSVILEVAAVVMSQRLTPFNEVVFATGAALALGDRTALEMHAKSGLLDACQQPSCLTIEEVQDKFQRWLAPLFANKEPIYLAGNSIHFDRAFLKRHMPNIEVVFHYRMLDVTSLHLAAEVFGAKQTRTKPIAHRALADVDSSIEQLEAYRSVNWPIKQNP